MELEELAKYAQIIKTAVLVIGGSGIAYLFYKINKEKKLISQAEAIREQFQGTSELARGNLSKAQETLELANELSGKPTYKGLKRFANEEYTLHKEKLDLIQQSPERYTEGIFEIEKKGQVGDFSTYIIKRTQGLVEKIEDGVKTYSTAASFVRDKEKTVSNIQLRTEKGEGIAVFPRQLSDSEREALMRRKISYEERYSCHDEGAYQGLLQGWRYTLQVLDGGQEGMKLEEDVTVF